MTPKNLLILFIFLLTLLSLSVVATITYSGLVPANHLETQDTSILFNWTINSTSSVDNPMPSYLFISDVTNASNFALNQTVRYCLNNTATGGNSTNNSCNTTVSGFGEGFYKWKIVTGEATTQATVTSTNAYPYNSSAGNDTLDFTYTVNGTVETCNVTFTQNHTLDFAVMIANFTQADTACNITVTNTSYLILTSQGYGEEEYITLDSGNASGILGLTTNSTTYGTQTNSSDSVVRWLEVRLEYNETNFIWQNDSDFIAMTLDKDTGELWTAGGLNTSGNLDNDGNITLDQTITFSLGGIIDYITNLFTFNDNAYVQGDLNTTGNITTPETINANIFNGTTVTATAITQDGNVVLDEATSWTGDLGGTGSSPSVDDNSHDHIASNINAGTFGAGDYVFPGELNMTGGDIIMNQTGTAYNMTGPDCIIFHNGFEICGS